MGRPYMLAGSLILFGVGAAAAWHDGYRLDLPALLPALMAILCAQLVAHYVNEIFDHEGDMLNRQRTFFSGGSGVLQTGKIVAQTAWWAAFFFTGCLLLFTLLAGLSTALFLPIGLVAVLLAWQYSAPPLRLSGSGLGEIIVPVLVVPLTAVTGYLALAKDMVPLVFVVGAVPFVLLQFCMIVAFTIPDFPSDLQSGKRTIAVRLGIRAAVWIHNLALLAAFGWFIVQAVLGWPWAALPCLLIPLALLQARLITQCVTANKGYPLLTLLAVLLFGASTALWLVETIFFRG